jgi:hypothetical protein
LTKKESSIRACFTGWISRRRPSAVS